MPLELDSLPNSVRALANLLAPQEDDGEPFQEKMARLAAQWREQQAEAQRLDLEIEGNLARLGFGAGE